MSDWDHANPQISGPGFEDTSACSCSARTALRTLTLPLTALHDAAVLSLTVNAATAVPERLSSTGEQAQTLDITEEGNRHRVSKVLLILEPELKVRLLLVGADLQGKQRSHKVPESNCASRREVDDSCRCGDCSVSSPLPAPTQALLSNLTSHRKSPAAGTPLTASVQAF